jgi:amino acid transporter
VTTSGRPSGLTRELTLGSAITLNMIDMIGVGPFITIPLIIASMGGPQAMLGWIAGAILALCDGLVWAELGAAMPEAGGSYEYLKQIYGPQSLGRLLSFLFIWQLSFSAPLSIASGCIGLAQYASFFWPGAESAFYFHKFGGAIPLLGTARMELQLAPATLIAIATCIVVVLLLYRGIRQTAWISRWLWAGVVATLVWIVFAGLTHFNARAAFDFPLGAFTLTGGFFAGLGSAMLIGTYDYWGYYNICFLAGEVKDPGRTIPRALIVSIVAVAAIYITMNISILGVVPWRDMVAAAHSGTHMYVVSTFMQRIYGDWAARIVTVLIMWTALASVFSLLLGYSRVPYAAALDGNYFRAFARLHPDQRFPTVSLISLGVVAILFCFLRLADVIAALVVIRIMLQFLLQAVGVIVLRRSRPEMPRPFRMWLYPLPAVVAFLGFIYVLVERPNALDQIRAGIVIMLVGGIIFFIRSWWRREWPFPGIDSASLP